MVVAAFVVYNFPNIVAGDTSPSTEFVLSETDQFNTVVGSDISFVAPDEINSVTTDLSIFEQGTYINVGSSLSNDGRYRVVGLPSATVLNVEEQTIVNEAAGEEVSLSGNVPIDITGASIRMYMRESCCATSEAPAKVWSTASNTISIVFPEAGVFRVLPQVMDIEPATYNFSIEVTFADDTIRTVVAGIWRVLTDATNP